MLIVLLVVDPAARRYREIDGNCFRTTAICSMRNEAGLFDAKRAGDTGENEPTVLDSYIEKVTS